MILLKQFCEQIFRIPHLQKFLEVSVHGTVGRCGTVRKGGRTVCKLLQNLILEWQCILETILQASSDPNYTKSERRYK